MWCCLYLCLWLLGDDVGCGVGAGALSIFALYHAVAQMNGAVGDGVRRRGSR